MPKPSSQPMYMMASSVWAERSTSGVPRQTGAASTPTTASSRLNTGRASGWSSRAAPKDAVTPTPITRARPRSTGRPACSNSRTSSQSAAALASTTSVLNIQPGALITMRRNTGSSTSALSRRFSTPDPRGAPSVTVAGVDTSHPTEAPGKDAKGVEQLVAPAVVEGHEQREARVVARLARNVLEPAAHGQRHAGRAADHPQPHLVLHQVRQLAVDRLLEQPHQHRDLVLRAVPVLRRERA